MEKKYFKSKENVFLKDAVIGDLCYLDSENDEIIEAARSRILYQENPQVLYHESLNRACTVELVIQEKPVTCPELGIVDPVNITSGSLIVHINGEAALFCHRIEFTGIHDKLERFAHVIALLQIMHDDVGRNLCVDVERSAFYERIGIHRHKKILLSIISRRFLPEPIHPGAPRYS